MKEILYVVNRVRSGNGYKITVVATLEKHENTYTYKPHNLSIDSIPRAKKVVNSRSLPPIAQRRLYSKNRPDINELLERYRLTHYDEWELLKRTNGRLFTDNLVYLTKAELEHLKRSPDIIDFFGEEEAVGRKRRLPQLMR